MAFNPGSPSQAASSDGGWVNLPGVDSGNPNGVIEYAPGYRVINSYQTPTSDAMAYFGYMPNKDQDKLTRLTWGFVGGQNAPDPSTSQWAWQQAVQYAASANAKDPSKRVSPWDVLERWAKKGSGPGGSGGSGGGGAGSGPRTIRQTSVSRNVQEVSRSQAKGLITSALESLVGRSFGAGEVDAFIEQFNAASKADPQVSRSSTTTNIDGKGNQSSSTSSTSSGGVDAQQQAEVFAKSRKDYAEYTTAVPLMDAFMQAIQSPVSGG